VGLYCNSSSTAGAKHELLTAYYFVIVVAFHKQDKFACNTWACVLQRQGSADLAWGADSGWLPGAHQAALTPSSARWGEKKMKHSQVGIKAI